MSNAYLTVQAPHAGERAALLNEDWLAVILGLFIFVLALAAIVNVDLIRHRWSTHPVWSNSLAKHSRRLPKAYSSLGGIGALLATYATLGHFVLSAGAAALNTNVKRFALAFTAASSGSPMQAG